MPLLIDDASRETTSNTEVSQQEDGISSARVCVVERGEGFSTLTIGKTGPRQQGSRETRNETGGRGGARRMAFVRKNSPPLLSPGVRLSIEQGSTDHGAEQSRRDRRRPTPGAKLQALHPFRRSLSAAKAWDADPSLSPCGEGWTAEGPRDGLVPRLALACAWCTHTRLSPGLAVSCQGLLASQWLPAIVVLLPNCNAPVAVSAKV